MRNAFFSKDFSKSMFGDYKLTEYGAQGISSGLNLSNALLGTGQRDDNAWSNGGNVGETGFSSLANTGGQIAGQFGPVGAGIQGGLQSIGAITDLMSYNPDVDPLENSYSSDQLPSFDLSEEAASSNNFIKDFNSSANKKVGSAALGGAAAGAAFGPVGAAIGGVAGGILGFAGKAKAKNEAEEARDKMNREYSSGIDRFNKSTEGFYNKENAMDKYRARQQSQGNMFNIPSGNPYFYLG